MMSNKDDFKYILQDTGHIYFGKELSYNEMMDLEEVPFKFKAIIGTYIAKDISLEETMQNHLIAIDDKSFSYKIFEQLKLEVKYFYKEESKSVFGKTKESFVHKTVKLSHLIDLKDKFISGEYIVSEISISKLGLMMISI